MKEKKKSAVSWILTWAGQKRIAYVWSVLLAIGNVIFKILPYFIIADVVKLFLNGEKEFEIYLAKAVLISNINQLFQVQNNRLQKNLLVLLGLSLRTFVYRQNTILDS